MRFMLPPRAVMAFVVLLATVGVGLSPASTLAATTGEVDFTGKVNVCNSVFTDSDLNQSRTEVSIDLPKVYMSTAFHDANPGKRQPVNVIVVTFALDAAGIPHEVGRSLQSGFANINVQPFVGSVVTAGRSQHQIFKAQIIVEWLRREGGPVAGRRTFKVDEFNFQRRGIDIGVTKDFCAPVENCRIQPPSNGVTVNQTIDVSLRFCQIDHPDRDLFGGELFYDGILQATTNLPNVTGLVLEQFKVPAGVAGAHVIRVRRADGQVSEALVVVKPRIKVIPGSGARDSTVNVSLRGYARQETVRIRWQKGSSFVTLATVVTSNTGSANVDIQVPKFAPDGLAKVRGDGTTNAAQTNVFQVAGGPFVAAKPPKQTATPSPTATPAPEIGESATPASGTTPAVSPEPTTVPSETVIAEPTAIPTVEPTPAATLEPTVEATQEPTTEPVPDVTPEPEVSPEVTVLAIEPSAEAAA